MTEEFKGHNGQVSVEGDWLTINRRGLGRLGHSKGDRRIPLANITAVQMRPAGSLANGFIKFSVPGSPELRGGLSDATKDENAVIFTKKQQGDFDRLREIVETYIGQHIQGVRGGGAAAAPDPADQLKKLADLRDAGVLTPEEFDAKKTDLLSRM